MIDPYDDTGDRPAWIPEDLEDTIPGCPCGLPEDHDAPAVPACAPAPASAQAGTAVRR